MFSILFIIATFLSGMFVECKYSPRICIRDNKLGIAYRTAGVDKFKIIF